MGKVQFLAAITDLGNKFFEWISQPGSLVIFLLLATGIFLFVLRMRKTPTGLRDKTREWAEQISTFMQGGRQEARLNFVICPNCKRGKGLFNPVYVTVGEERHIEGTCSTCGHFVRTRLK